MKAKDTTITIRINKKTKDEFTKVAYLQQKTPSVIIDEFIKKYVEKNYKLLEKTAV